jgi:hypothetical protein
VRRHCYGVTADDPNIRERCPMRPAVPVRVFGGPTVLIEYAGLRLLTDPTFDAPGSYDLGTGLVLTKTAPSAITPDALGPVDAVLLSHDQHPTTSTTPVAASCPARRRPDHPERRDEPRR